MAEVEVPEAQHTVPRAQLDAIRQRYGDDAQMIIVRLLLWETWRRLWSSDVGCWFYRLGSTPSQEAKEEHAFKLFLNSNLSLASCPARTPARDCRVRALRFTRPAAS